LDNLTLMVQKEKFKWLRVHLAHLIITNAVDMGIDYPVLQDFVTEYLDFFGDMDDVKIKGH